MSGGFAVVQPGSKLSINAVEGYPLEDFSSEVRCLPHLPRWRPPLTSLQSVKNQIQEAQRIAGGQGSEQDVAEAKIELEVRQHIMHTWHY